MFYFMMGLFAYLYYFRVIAYVGHRVALKAPRVNLVEDLGHATKPIARGIDLVVPRGDYNTVYSAHNTFEIVLY